MMAAEEEAVAETNLPAVSYFLTGRLPCSTGICVIASIYSADVGLEQEERLIILSFLYVRVCVSFLVSESIQVSRTAFRIHIARDRPFSASQTQDEERADVDR